MARKAHWTPWRFETQAIAAIGCIGTAWGGSLGVILPFRFFMGAGVALASAGSAAYLVDMTERPHLRAVQ